MPTFEVGSLVRFYLEGETRTGVVVLAPTPKPNMTMIKMGSGTFFIAESHKFAKMEDNIIFPLMSNVGISDDSLQL